MLTVNASRARDAWGHFEYHLLLCELLLGREMHLLLLLKLLHEDCLLLSSQLLGLLLRLVAKRAHHVTTGAPNRSELGSDHGVCRSHHLLACAACSLFDEEVRWRLPGVYLLLA